MSKDYYSILGVDKNSSEADIKKAYRRLSKKYHPDTGSGDEEKFKEISEAYSVLSDPQKKYRYDRGDNGGFDFGFGDIFGGGFGFDFSDIFGRNNNRSNQMGGSDIRIKVELTLDEIEIGVTKNIKYNRKTSCDKCNGEGGTGKSTCGVCHGKGRIVSTVRTPIGIMHQETMCNHCGGSGHIVKNICNTCNGEGYKNISENLTIETPIGAMDSVMYKYIGKGNGNKNGAGDLLVQFSVKPHKYFKRQENDLIYNISVPFNILITGGNIEFEGLNKKKIKVDIPPMSKPGYVIHLKRHGLPYMDNNNMIGNMLLNLMVDFPDSLTEEELKIINSLNYKDNFIYKQK